MKNKQDFKSLTRKELIKWFQQKNIPGFRAKQIFNWIYKNYARSFDQMLNLPEKLKEDLEQVSFMTEIELENKLVAADRTRKYLWMLEDKNIIESVFIPYQKEGRYSVCISSQVGCAMECIFCATGAMGIKRNLTTGEIVDQVLKMQEDVGQETRISNIVFMGMGEPFNNTENVLRAINIFNDEQGLNIAQRKITVSTSGLIPGVLRLADEGLQVGLAISLNAPNNKLRNRIMPVNRKYPLEELLEAVKLYLQKTNRRVTFEYVLIRGVNDSLDLAYQTANLLRGLLCHVNLIPVNPVPELNIKRPTGRTVENFERILAEKGIQTTVRQERGTDISAACGQLCYRGD